MVDEGLKGDLEVDGRKYGLVLDIGGYYKNVVTLAPSLHISQARDGPEPASCSTASCIASARSEVAARNRIDVAAGEAIGSQGRSVLHAAGCIGNHRRRR